MHARANRAKLRPVQRAKPSQDRPRRAIWHVGLFAAVTILVASGANCGGGTPKPTSSGAVPTAEVRGDAPRAEFRLFAFGHVLGTVAPCGCTTQPLGGLQYAFGYIESHSTASNRLVLEPGSFLFPKPGGAQWPTDAASWEQAHARAKLLHSRFAALGGALVSGLGPTDLAAPEGAKPLADYPMPRVVANVVLGPEAGAAPPRHKLVELSDHGITWNVAVTAVVDPTLVGAEALGTVQPAVQAVEREIAAMKAAGSQFNVVLANGYRPFAEQIAREVKGVDLVVVGIPKGIVSERLGGPSGRIGTTMIFEPGTQLQTVSELRLSVDAAGKAVVATEQWANLESKTSIEAELARTTARLTKFKADPSADAGFLRTLEAQRVAIEQRLKLQPEGPAVAILDQVRVTCKLPVDAAARTALKHYDGVVASQNKTRFAGVKPPAPAKGVSGYVGTEACADCHEEAVTFWKTTRHASAYKTLVDDNKEFDLTCVGCHVTGFRKPGGSEVVENAGLRDVQCEVCHGAGELHVEDGGELEGLIKRDAPAELCATQCHTAEHSDTFEYEAYLRDVLGPGHGESRRTALGDGATGHELRAAGFAKAGGTCKKM